MDPAPVVARGALARALAAGIALDRWWAVCRAEPAPHDPDRAVAFTYDDGQRVEVPSYAAAAAARKVEVDARVDAISDEEIAGRLHRLLHGPRVS